MISPRCAICGDKIKPPDDTVTLDGRTMHEGCAFDPMLNDVLGRGPVSPPQRSDTYAPSHTYQPPALPGAKVRSAKAERNARKAARRARARVKR